MHMYVTPIGDVVIFNILYYIATDAIQLFQAKMSRLDFIMAALTTAHPLTVFLSPSDVWRTVLSR